MTFFWSYGPIFKEKKTNNKKVKVLVHFIGSTLLLFAFFLFGTPNIIGCTPQVLRKKKKNLVLFHLIQYLLFAPNLFVCTSLILETIK